MSSMACSTSRRRPAGREEDFTLPVERVHIERDREERPLVFRRKQHRLERRDRLVSVAECSPRERPADR